MEPKGDFETFWGRIGYWAAVAVFVWLTLVTTGIWQFACSR